ncbi:hypothetical protein DAEQUDRAFT_688366 [Daedalea quercina L-15889]|uniref:Uncharacterized protein n=1 Tax=Daedalea quercina L-15889 TaxID=1314783 RepID=A0A165RNQ6_9APHY|nr:hypothetical protein DAEQUDRAFT_688366 [Daedalea quercina L-15889]
MSTSSSSDTVSPTSSRSPPLRPSQRMWPSADDKPHRQESIGIDPRELIGKVVKGIRRSSTHPCVTLYFADNTAYQIRVDGYDPRHRGVPKTLECDSNFEPYLNHSGDLLEVHLTVANAAKVTLSDKAFDSGGRGSRWDQAHSGIALKFVEEGHWHCVWAQLAEYDDRHPMTCTFRSYHDVYLDALRPTSKKSKSHRRKGRSRR